MNVENIATLVEKEVREEIFQPKIDALDKGVFIEVGTYVGGNLCRVGQMIKESGKDIKLIGIDYFKFDNISDGSLRDAGLQNRDNGYDICLNNIKECELENIIDLINGDSIEISKTFEDESVDLLFLDGTHGYGYCVEELKHWIPKVKTGGIVSGHDYPTRDIRQAVAKYFNNVNVTSTNGGYWVVK